MRKIDLKKLTAAITATAIVATNVTPSLSYDVTPASFFNTVNSQVAAGQYASALQLVAKLKAMGVKFITVAGKKITLEELGSVLSQDTVAAAFMVRNLRMAAAAGAVDFGVGQRLVSAPPSFSKRSLDNFPISSMG